jgi:hypothetical protein
MITEPLKPQSLVPGADRNRAACEQAEPSCKSMPRHGRAGQFFGAMIMRLCAEGRRECTKPNCWLQPVCACARADLAAARRVEARVWTLIAICGAIVIIFSAIWAIW